MSLERIPIREWAKKAINSRNALASSPGRNHSYSQIIEPQQSLAKSSDSFLSSALKVAFCLADELCKAEEAAACTQSDYGNQNAASPGLPVPSHDWASHIFIRLNSLPGLNSIDTDGLSAFGDNILQPLPFDSMKPSSTPVEKSFLPNEAPPFENVHNEEKKEQSRHNSNYCSYLDVNGAEFLPSLTKDVRGNLNEKKERLYSLGLVFYELFSGGNIPPELQSEKTSPLNIQQKFDPDTSDFYASFEPLPISEAATINFGDALQILDDIGSDDELFGHVCRQEKDENDDEDVRRQTKKSRDSTAKSSGCTACSVSIEPLKMQNLPVALCDLIENMLDSALGDFSKDEAYGEMKDVRSDLQLMLEKPNRFLCDLDLDQLSVTGLQLDNFEHELESSKFSTLLSAYKRSISGRSEFAIISGPSGVGKTVLAKQLGSWARANGGTFLSGKFDQLRHAQSLSAIVEALNDYCGALAMDKESDRAKSFSSELRLVLGQDAYYLARVIPNLGQMLDHEGLENDLPQQEYQDGQKRLQYLVCQFLEVISLSSPFPVTLFLDDMQWADPSSVEVIKRLLFLYGSSNTNARFFFLGCCRENEICPDLLIWKMLPCLKSFGINTTLVSLSCMDKEVLNMVVSNVLCLSPRLTRTLSEILYVKTKGNQLFLSRLLRALNREGLLRVSLSRRRWVWQEEKIQLRELPDDVAAFFVSTIRQLSLEVQSAICVVSCFGRSAEQLIPETLEKELNMQLIRPLEEAVAEGLLMKIDGVFKFSHDRVQDVAQSMMESRERSFQHSKYGLVLCSEALKRKNDSMLFIAVSQLNRGGPTAIVDKAQGVTVARMNLMVGKKWVEMSDFGSAFSYFHSGIPFLGQNHWEENYELSLELFECASKAAFVIGDMDNLSLLSDQILKNARSFEDKLNTLYITTNALANASKIQESADKGISILSQLGEEIPAECSKSDVEFHTMKTRRMFEGVSDEKLLNYNQMTDNSKIVAMKFLAKLNAALYMIRPGLQPLITLKMVQLSLVYGMSPMSPQAFAFFGSLIASLGDIREGYRFVKIASDLNEKYGSKEFAGEVVCVSTQLKCFVEPVQTTNELQIEGRNVSMAAGDMYNALVNSLLYCASALWSGTNLMLITQHFISARHLMEQQNHITWQMQLAPIERTVVALIGPFQTDGRSELSAEHTRCRETPLEIALLQKNPYQSMVHFFHKMLISFFFREFDGMKNFAEKYVERILPSSILLYGYSVRAFFTGLVSFWIGRSNNDRAWIQRGQSAITLMKHWADSSRWNFENKKYLLEAEEQYCQGNFERAILSYDKAITSAREHKFIHEEALACELAGYFRLDRGEKEISAQYFKQAQDRYREWGASAKARQLNVLVGESIALHPRGASAPSTPDILRQNGLQEQVINSRKRASLRSLP